jgi:hypothetical protein
MVGSEQRSLLSASDRLHRLLPPKQPNPAFRLFEQTPSRHHRKGELFPRVRVAGRSVE